ncbi:toxin-antitoxin system HicB family antitoxin [Paenibacillus pasadenensis]|nr:toxin-antitoxin system HicB family antitoxin [Paenibacillus pasadenensis]MCM3746179.1 toxin-antitoxin system HicB family antitoxin [Paenibacillus pasadenensis]
MSDKDLAYYMALPYTLVIKEITDETGHYYFGSYLELDGCQSHGDTMAELVESIKEAKEDWLSVKLEFGDPIPEPVSGPDERYSGKFNLRLPKSLHRQLSETADLEGVSLNQYILFRLSQ